MTFVSSIKNQLLRVQSVTIRDECIMKEEEKRVKTMKRRNRRPRLE